MKLGDRDLNFEGQTFQRLFWQGWKSKHYNFHKIWVTYLPSNGAIAHHHDLDLQFQGIWNVKIMKTDSANENVQVLLYSDWYSPSNGTVVNVVLRDLDLNFLYQIFDTLVSRKRWELSQKNAGYVFYRGWYSSSNGTTFNVVIRENDRHFQYEIFSSYAFVIKIAQGYLKLMCLDLHGPAVELLLFLQPKDSVRKRLSQHFDFFPVKQDRIQSIRTMTNLKNKMQSSSRCCKLFNRQTQRHVLLRMHPTSATGCRTFSKSN